MVRGEFRAARSGCCVADDAGAGFKSYRGSRRSAEAASQINRRPPKEPGGGGGAAGEERSTGAEEAGGGGGSRSRSGSGQRPAGDEDAFH